VMEAGVSKVRNALFATNRAKYLIKQLNHANATRIILSEIAMESARNAKHLENGILIPKLAAALLNSFG